MQYGCLNYLTVLGPKRDVKAFQKKAKGYSPWPENKKEEKEPNVLNFHSFVPIPDEVLAAGYEAAGYDWEEKNWGCGWAPYKPGMDLP